MRIFWAFLLCLGIPSVAESQLVADSVVSDSLHLIGTHVVRYKAIGVTKQRVLIRGVRLPNGLCHYVAHGPLVAGWSQWEEEADTDTCTSIQGQGPGDGGPHLDLQRGRKDSMLVRRRDSDTQEIRRKGKP